MMDRSILDQPFKFTDLCKIYHVSVGNSLKAVKLASKKIVGDEISRIHGKRFKRSMKISIFEGEIMKFAGKIAFVVQAILFSTMSFAAPDDRDVYILNVDWIHSAASHSTNIQGSDVKLYRNYINSSESLGHVRVRIVGPLAQDCVAMASQSAAGSAQIHLFTDRNSARYEISELPTYIINASAVRSCGLKKNK